MHCAVTFLPNFHCGVSHFFPRNFWAGLLYKPVVISARLLHSAVESTYDVPRLAFARFKRSRSWTYQRGRIQMPRWFVLFQYSARPSLLGFLESFFASRVSTSCLICNKSMQGTSTSETLTSPKRCTASSFPEKINKVIAMKEISFEKLCYSTLLHKQESL